MANAVIGHSNQIDVATLSGGSWLSALPLTNLQNRSLGKVARSTDATEASTKFIAAFSAATSVRVVALAAHNLSDAAQIKVQGSTVSNFATTVYDSGWVDVWPSAYLATVSDKGIDIWTKVHVFPVATSAQYWQVLLKDTTNPDGYVQIGRPFIGPGFQPTINLAYGGGIGIETPTPIQTALNGAEYFDRRPSVRTVRVSTAYMTEAEAMNDVYEITRRGGIDGEVVFVWNPDDTTHAPRRQFMGRIRALSQVENPYTDQWNYAWEIKELI